MPAFNESKHIANVIGTMPSFVDHVLVVDDASTDNTVEVASSVRDARLEIIRRDQNIGVGAAILTGHRRAIDLGADISVVMAGDGQMDPDFLPSLLDAIVEAKYDYAKGNRFMAEGLEKMPRLRILGNTVLSFLTKAASGYWSIFDSQNGYTAIRTSTLRRLPLNRIAQGFNFENDMLVRLNIIGSRVKDVAIPARYGNERSKVRLGSFAVTTLAFLFKAFHSRLYRKYLLDDLHPFALLYISAMLLLTWSLSFSSYLIYSRLLRPELLSPSTGTVMLAIVPLFVGIQFLLTALLIDLEEGKSLTWSEGGGF